MKKVLALFIFDDVEVMDFAGPFEVFSVANELNNHDLFDIKIISVNSTPVRAKNGLFVNPDCSINEISKADIVIIPGGDGTRPLLKHKEVINWIKKISLNAEVVASVCSGALLLAQAGLLSGLKATTHHQVLETLRDMAENIQVVDNIRFIDNGKIITSAGISAGIDMSFYIVERFYGQSTAEATARYMEYSRFIK